MLSDYAQTFFKSDDKQKLRELDYGRSPVRVRQIIMKSNGEARAKPLCFVCNNFVSRHFLGECLKFEDLSKESKRQTVIDVGRCLNCLFVGHFCL